MSNDIDINDAIMADAETFGLADPDLIDEDGQAGGPEAPEIPGLAEYKGDTNYESEKNGQKYHNHFAPGAWDKLWWYPAKREIFAAQADKREALILDIAYTVGRAIACHPKPDTPERRPESRTSAVNLLSGVGTHFGVLKSGDMRILGKFTEGFQAGPYKDGEDIPEFLVEAIDAIPEAKLEPAKAGTDSLEHGSLAGILSDGDGSLPDKLPPAPLKVFPAEIRAVIEKVSETKCIPYEMTMCIVLALVSACVGRARGIAIRKDWKEHANFFMILVAESGAGKSHAFKYVFKELLKVQADTKAEFKRKCRLYLEEMGAYRKSKDPDKKLPDRPENVQYMLGDSTFEAASELMEDNPKGLLWSIDEMSGWFSRLDKYNRSGGSDGKSRLLSAWNAEEWNTSRKSKDGMPEERYIAKGAMGVFGGIQPHHLKNLFTVDDMKQGLPQRFAYVRAVVDKPMRMDTPEIPDEIDRIIERITRRMLSLEMTADALGSSQAVYLTCEPDARAEIVHMGNLIAARTFGTEGYTFAVKMLQMLPRLALILHILKWASTADDTTSCPDVIDYDTAMNAIKLTDWLMTHTEAVRAALPGARKAKRGDAPAIFGAKEKLREIIAAMPAGEREIYRTLDEIRTLIGEEISDINLGKALKDIGIFSKQIREGDKRVRKYRLSDHLSQAVTEK